MYLVVYFNILGPLIVPFMSLFKHGYNKAVNLHMTTCDYFSLMAILAWLTSVFSLGLYFLGVINFGIEVILQPVLFNFLRAAVFGCRFAT